MRYCTTLLGLLHWTPPFPTGPGGFVPSALAVDHRVPTPFFAALLHTKRAARITTFYPASTARAFAPGLPCFPANSQAVAPENGWRPLESRYQRVWKRSSKDCVPPNAHYALHYSPLESDQPDQPSQGREHHRDGWCLWQLG